MKISMTFLAIAALLSANAQAKTEFKYLDLDWSASVYDQDGMSDGDVLIVTLPLANAADVKAKIVDQSRISSEEPCKVLRVTPKYEQHIVEVVLKMGATETEEGFNGCTAKISRNLPTDKANKTGTIVINYGYSVED